MAKHSMPARGVMQGIKQDLAKARDSETGFAPNGIGNAYSHNFLNQKPWHPANFRNQARVYEAEQKQLHEAKQREIAKAEFQAEQEFLQTLAFLSPEEQQRHRERQGVQFLYMKPPGADSLAAGPPAKEPDKAAQSSGAAAAGAAAAGGAVPGAAEGRDGGGRPGPQQPGAKPSYLGNMLGAVRALQHHDKWEVRHVAGVGRSPPRGAADPQAANQQILVGSDSDEEQQQQQLQRPGAGTEPEAGSSRKRRRKDRLAQAEAVLREAGYDVEQIRAATAAQREREGRSGKKARRERKAKRRKRSPSR